MSKLLLGAISDYVSWPICLTSDIDDLNSNTFKQWDGADEEIDDETKGTLDPKANANDDSDEEDEVVDDSDEEDEE